MSEKNKVEKSAVPETKHEDAASNSRSKKVRKTNNKVVKKSSKISLFIDVAPDKYFILCDGKTVKDYQELASLLETLNDDVFYYHVNSERNDFANWVNDVFGEEKLASEIRKTKSKTEMVAVIYKHLFHKLADLMK
jgi:hypothetical protein